MLTLLPKGTCVRFEYKDAEDEAWNPRTGFIWGRRWLAVLSRPNRNSASSASQRSRCSVCEKSVSPRGFLEYLKNGRRGTLV